MDGVDLRHWEFSFGGGHQALKGTPNYVEPEMLAFAESLDLLMHLAGDRTHEPSIQTQVRRRLRDDPIAKQWHSQRAICGHRHQPVVGGRHDLHTDLDGISVLGDGHRCVQPQGGGLPDSTVMLNYG